jgi:hypothetical protein
MEGFERGFGIRKTLKDVTQYDLLREMIRGRDERLKIQAAEYERRLEALNHENERIMEILKQSMPREVFEKEIQGINARIQVNTDYMNGEKGRMRLERFIPWAIAIAALVISYIKK